MWFICTVAITMVTIFVVYISHYYYSNMLPAEYGSYIRACCSQMKCVFTTYDQRAMEFHCSHHCHCTDYGGDLANEKNKHDVG